MYRLNSFFGRNRERARRIRAPPTMAARSLSYSRAANHRHEHLRKPGRSAINHLAHHHQRRSVQVAPGKQIRKAADVVEWAPIWAHATTSDHEVTGLLLDRMQTWNPTDSDSLI
jgi:hypothetical protein